jgi:hypothetical protein
VRGFQEEAFLATLEQGLAYLQEALRNNPSADLPPEVVTHLYTRLGKIIILSVALFNFFNG